MKEYLQVKKQILPYHQERTFLKALKHTSKEHGFKGPFGVLSFLWIRNLDHWLQVLSRIMPFSGIRVKLQRMRGVKIAKNVHLGPLITIDDVYPYFVIINRGASIDGNNYILTHSKPLLYHSEVGESYVAPVIIEKFVDISINVIILPGVTIGEGSIIGAGSVVTKSIPPMVFAAGIPAQVKKDIAPKLKKNYTEEKFNAILEKRKKEFGF
jgi:acetyltransferase-like isoleucine patch superfamily enzyme